jgi:hypothetical protein
MINNPPYLNIINKIVTATPRLAAANDPTANANPANPANFIIFTSNETVACHTFYVSAYKLFLLISMFLLINSC